MRSSEDISTNLDFVESPGPRIKSRAPLHGKGSTTSLNEVRI